MDLFDLYELCNDMNVLRRTSLYNILLQFGPTVYISYDYYTYLFTKDNKIFATVVLKNQPF